MTAPAQNPATFDNPAPLGGNEPRPRDLIGRTVFIQPTLIERVPKLGTKTGETEDRITANITVIDGGPLQFGGAPEKQPVVPHTMTVAVPYTATDVFISQTNLVKACKRSLPSAARPQGGVVVGFVEFGKQSDPTKNAPINLTELDAADPRRLAAGVVLNAIISGSFVNPGPVEITAAAPTQATYVPPASSPVTPVMDPNYAAFLASQAAQQQAAAGAPVATQATYVPPVDPAYAAFLAQQAAAAAPTIPQAPAGWTAEVWAQLTEQQRSAILGQQAAPAGAPPL